MPAARHFRLGLVVAFSWFCAGLVAAAARDASTALAAQHRAEESIEKRFSHVPQTPLDAAARLIASGEVILLDVREPDEFLVSHIAGARRIDPDASVDDVRRLIGAPPKNKTILLYCTIGFRSSRLADRIGAAFGGEAGPPIVSMRGGLIAWANANRPLVDSKGQPTNRLHPYDANRASMLIEPERATGKLHQWF